MRQGNGSDLLGLKDPRSTKIGIIYVGSNDDRKNILAAILTQEKLDRKQIAIVLPENQPNKAFQSLQDFDDLKTVRRKLHAELIFVILAGSGLAEFARQRRFSVYSSLESYTDALRAEPLPAEARQKRKKGRLFGLGKKTVPLASAVAGGVAAGALSHAKGQPVPMASPDPSVNKAENAPKHPPSPYADLPTADLDPQPSGDNTSSMSAPGANQASLMPITDTKDTAAPSPARSIAVAAGGAAAGFIAADLIQKNTQGPVPPGVPSASMDHDWDALPPTPSPQTNESSASFAQGTTPPHTPSSAPDTPNPTVGTGPGIIELPPSTRTAYGQSAAKQPPMDAAAASTNTVQPSATPLLRPASQRRNTGKTPVVAGAMATASAAHGAGVNRPPARPTQQTGAATRKKSNARGLIIGILIVALLLIGSGIVICTSSSQLSHFGLFAGGNTSPATITITPDSKVKQDSYVIQAVTSNADPNKRQVSSRQLTFSPQKQSKSITPTGVGHIAAKTATGQLTFYNGSNQSFWVGSTTAIPGPNGVSVEPDSPVNIPAAHPPTEGSITVNAHATTGGTNGNIAAGAINKNCCTSGSFITVVNSAFTGGQDTKDYTFLQQSDVDSAVNQLTPALTQQAQNGFKGQIKPNEQLVNAPQCSTQPSVDQTVGDQGKNVTSANVTVSATCTGLAYDASGAQALAENLLKKRVLSDLGQGYVLAGAIVTKQTVTDTKDGVVTLQVAVASTWYYQFDDKQKQELAQQLTNKSREAAQKFLNDYRGIARASIDIANGGNTLPGDAGQISIKILTISGASPTDLPTLPSVGPTSPLTTSKGRG